MRSLKDVARQQAAGKALQPHPALQGVEPVSVYSPGANRSEARISQREAKRHLEAYGGDQPIDWLMDCIDLYADTAATAEFHLEREGERVWIEKTVDTPPDAEIVDDRLKLLLEQPNPYMDWAELMHLLVVDFLLVGNAYWYKWRMNDEDRPLALYRLAPPYVHVVPGPWGVKHYEYQPPGVAEPMKIEPTELIHFKRPNPHSAYYGLGIVQGGGRPFDLELALTDTQTAFYENRADPSLVIQSERRVPRDVMNKLRAQLRARHAGPKRAGELMVLEAGLRAETISSSAKDSLFEELTKMSRDRIMAMFRASPLLFGVTDGTAGGQNKLADAQRQFDNKAMKPFLRKLQSRITISLIAAWGYDFQFDYRYIMPEEEVVKLGTTFAATPGIRVKEIRQFYVDAGLLKSASTGDPTVDEMILNLPGEELDEDGQGGHADRNLPGEPGRPPNGENTKAFPRTGRLPSSARARPSGKALMSALEARLDVIPEGKAVKLESPENVSVGRRLSKEERPEDSVAAERAEEIDAIAASLRNDLLDATHVLERTMLDHVEGKAFDPGSLARRVRSSEAWKTFLSMASAAIERAAQRGVSSAAVHQSSAGVFPEGELDYETIVREVVYRPEGVRKITENLKQEIVQKVSEAVKQGATRQEVEQIIREATDFWRETHAETVALTEAVHAYNEGTLSVAEAAGADEVVVEDGHDHDQPCRDADGQVWTIEHARLHRLEHPRCRRAFTPLAVGGVT